MVSAGVVISGNALAVVKRSHGRRASAGIFGLVTKTLPIGNARYLSMLLRCGITYLPNMWHWLCLSSSLGQAPQPNQPLCIPVRGRGRGSAAGRAARRAGPHGRVLLVAEGVLYRAQVVDVLVLLLATQLEELFNVGVEPGCDCRLRMVSVSCSSAASM